MTTAAAAALAEVAFSAADMRAVEDAAVKFDEEKMLGSINPSMRARAAASRATAFESKSLPE